MICEKKSLLQKYSRILSISKLFSLESPIGIYFLFYNVNWLNFAVCQFVQNIARIWAVHEQHFIEFVKSIYMFFYNIAISLRD